MDTSYSQEPIKLKNLFARLRGAFVRLWLVVLALTIGLSALSFLKDRRSFVPMYESSAIFTISADYTPDDIFSTSTYYDQYAARQMAASFSQILSTQAMRDLIVQEVGYINATASATAVAESNLMVLRTYSSDPQAAYDYLCAIIDCYPQVAQYIATNPKVRIMQQPAVAKEPYNYFDGAYSAMRGGVIGLVLGLVLVLCYALTISTVQTVDELKNAVNLPIIVTLPKVNTKKRRKKASGLITAESDPNMAESLRGLRVKVKKLLDAPQKKVVLVTSTIAGEGKTTVAINLARALKDDGHKVLLLDADLRSQSVARAMGEKAAGYNLLECLRNPDVSILDLIRTSGETSLEFVSGRNADARHYSINTRAMEQLLEVLTLQYDYVVVDTAPCEVVSDTAALCRCADCVLYVVRQDHARTSQIQDSVTMLHQKDVQITGCIFNGEPRSHHSYGYGYRKYGYGYGYKKYGYGYSKYAKAAGSTEE